MAHCGIGSNAWSEKRGLVLAMLVLATAGVLGVHSLAVLAADNDAVRATTKEKAFDDPLDVPAVVRMNAAQRPLMSVTGVGQHLRAAGMRGLIIRSEDGGKTWSQSVVPVQSDLLALSFPTESEGWAVGHDGVVLHSVDGGKVWQRQLDGRIAAESLVSAYKKRVEAGEAAMQPFLDQLQLGYKNGPSLPLLSVAFTDRRTGFVVGSFGMIAATTDGGATWQPWLERIDNPQFLHLNQIREVAGSLYIAAEKGTIFKFDPRLNRFIALTTDYSGSFFGVVGNAHKLLAYGLRGTVYGSNDRGVTWKPVVTSLHGTITTATYLEERGLFVLATSSGEMAVCDSNGNECRSVNAGTPTIFTGLFALSATEVMASGMNGMQKVDFH